MKRTQTLIGNRLYLHLVGELVPLVIGYKIAVRRPQDPNDGSWWEADSRCKFADDLHGFRDQGRFTLRECYSPEAPATNPPASPDAA